MIGWFWRLYIPVAILVLLGIPGRAIAPLIEGRWFPIRTDQRIADVVRFDDRICWDWISTKRRPIVSDNMDVFIETPQDRAVSSIFEQATLEPWGRSRAKAVRAAPWHQVYCVLLPPSIAPDTPVRVTQVAYYPGWLGLWEVALRLPDVVDARAGPAP